MHSIFEGIDEYIDAALDINHIGTRAPHYACKRSALITSRPDPFDSAALLRKMTEKIEKNWGAIHRTASSENWRWEKKTVRSDRNNSKEKILEKRIATEMNSAWVNQVPTASGLLNSTGGKLPDRLDRVLCRNNMTAALDTRDIRHVFLMTGANPNTSWLAGCLALDERGFVKTGVDLASEDLTSAQWKLTRRPYLLEASLPGVFAVGDVRSGNVKRVASAVGEGSIAISMVHKVLQEWRDQLAAGAAGN